MIAPAKKSARQQILDAVTPLFYREGVRAVGVDLVVAQAGVAKMTLYHHFPSKDDLVVAFLEESNRRYWEWWDRAIAEHPDSPRQQLADLFAALARRVTRPDYRGCPFMNTSTEFPDPHHPGRAIIVANKQEVARRLGDLVARAGARDPETLAGQLALLFDGAYASAQTLGASGPAARVGQMAEVLIACHLGSESPRPS